MAGYVTYCGAFNLAGQGSVEMDCTYASGVHNGERGALTQTHMGTVMFELVHQAV